MKLSEAISRIEKQHGAEIGCMGGWYETADRIPSGIFPLDLAIGGGIPKSRVTEIFGPEGSGKTNLAISILAQELALEPAMFGAVIDMEGTWDPQWAKKFGVDPARVYVVRPDVAEELHDIMAELLEAQDVGLIILDSLAAVITSKEGNSGADQGIMGNTAIAIRRMTNMMTLRMKRMRKQGLHTPAVIFINQVRTKIGQMFGNPETTPGGNAPKFMYSLRIRLYGKAKMDKAISEILPVARETQAVVVKHKIPITSLQAKYDMITIAHDGYKIGDVDDWNLVESLSKNHGLLTKEKKGYTFFGTEYKTLTLVREHYRTDTAFRLEVQAQIAKLAISESGYQEEGELPHDDVEFDPVTGEVIE